MEHEGAQGRKEGRQAGSSHIGDVPEVLRACAIWEPFWFEILELGDPWPDLLYRTTKNSGQRSEAGQRTIE